MQHFKQCWTHPGTLLAELTSGSKLQAVFACFCGQHITVKEVAWVNTHPTALVCRDMTCLNLTHEPESFGSQQQYVSEDAKAAALQAVGVRPQSTLERQATALLHGLFPGCQIMVDVRLTAGTIMFNKATDLYVGQPFDLLVEVDGAQHFSKPWGGSGGEVQRETDMRFNQLAAENNMNLIRLHHKDEGKWAEKLRAAKFARLQGQRVDMRTRSYGNM